MAGRFCRRMGNFVPVNGTGPVPLQTTDPCTGSPRSVAVSCCSVAWAACHPADNLRQQPTARKHKTPGCGIRPGRPTPAGHRAGPDASFWHPGQAKGRSVVLNRSNARLGPHGRHGVISRAGSQGSGMARRARFVEPDWKSRDCMDAPFQTGPVRRRHRIHREATATNVGPLKDDAETWLRFVCSVAGVDVFRPDDRRPPACFVPGVSVFFWNRGPGR
jgi:hypothetical protein